MIYEPGPGLIIRTTDLTHLTQSKLFEVELLKTGNDQSDYEYYVLVADEAVDVHTSEDSASESFDTIVEALTVAFNYLSSHTP